MKLTTLASFISSTSIILLLVSLCQAQIPRQRVNTEMEPLELFRTQNLAAQSTVNSLPAGNLNVTILHTFGIITDQPLNNFFGLDFGPNVRLGLDYGITGRWSVGVGRSSRQKVFDLRTKMALLKQNQSGSVPLSLSFKGDVGITTVKNGFDFIDRLSFLTSLPLARSITKDLTLQVTPMYAHFNTVFRPDDPNDYIAAGIGGQYVLNKRYALFFEYYQNLSEQAFETTNAFTTGLNIQTGGHMFQLFLASAPWHTEQYVIYRNTDNFWAGDFRLGFNVNRLFGVGN